MVYLTDIAWYFGIEGLSEIADICILGRNLAERSILSYDYVISCQNRIVMYA